MSFYIFARLHAREGAEEQLENVQREMLAPVRADSGCMSIAVFRATRESREFYVHSRWIDEAEFDRHVEMPHTQRFVNQAQPLLDHELRATRTRLLD